LATKNNSEFEIGWMTISYRSLVVAILLFFILGGIGIHWLWPNNFVFQAFGNYADRAMQRLISSPAKHPVSIGSQQAHFTALDGTVRVKKSTSNAWVAADFSLPLDKGDVIQTSSEGMAKVFFPDGTSYSVKPDSLIVVEENSANEQQQTQVAVQVTTGTVDLTTAAYAQGSTSQVIVAGATASIAPESSAMVHNDPHTDQHEILVKKGSGKVTRQQETVVLSENDKLSFQSESPEMTRTREAGPPTLITPSNMMPVYVSAVGKPVDFSWTPSSDSGTYRLRVSLNPYFSSTIFDKTVSGASISVPGLKEGAYYWVVTSRDAKGHESEESDRSQFTIVRRDTSVAAMDLELDPFVQHGHVIEVKGKTDPTARVMVNGQEVPLIRADGSFNFFTPPLHNGENTITVTAQNARGGVKTEQKKVVIE
jgi:Glucodextranase, domain B/FecR protein